MAPTRSRSSKPVSRKRTLRTLELTAAYCPAAEGGYTAEILEAKGVYSQGDTFDEARRNLYDVVALTLEEAPHQFGLRPSKPAPGALLEKLFVLMPQAA